MGAIIVCKECGSTYSSDAEDHGDLYPRMTALDELEREDDFYQALDAAAAKFVERNPQYAEQWRQYQMISLADIVRGKAHRVIYGILTGDLDDALEEIVDIICYAAFVWVRLRDAKEALVREADPSL